MYKILRSFLFLFDPERVHYFSMNCLKLICKIGFLEHLVRTAFMPRNSVPFKFLGLEFPNRVGLGAGFDKNAKYLQELEALGFGFVEIGTVTPLPQEGNEKPRLFRLPADKALLNRMGFNNDGAGIIAQRLANWNDRKATARKMIIGGNIGKNKITANEMAWKDYENCFNKLYDHVDYFVVNVSSPNTPGLRELQEKESLRKIFTVLQKSREAKTIAKPILLKIAPDLTRSQVDDVIDLAMEIKLDGLVAANTSIDRTGLSEVSAKACRRIGAGGLSGLPLSKRSTEMIGYIHQQTKGSIPIIGSGGIFTGADANEKIAAGASLLQVWTGFIYEGPCIVKNICSEITTKD